MRINKFLVHFSQETVCNMRAIRNNTCIFWACVCVWCIYDKQIFTLVPIGFNDNLKAVTHCNSALIFIYLSSTVPRICLYSKWSKDHILIHFTHFHSRKTKLILMIKFEWIWINSECWAFLFSTWLNDCFFFLSFYSVWSGFFVLYGFCGFGLRIRGHCLNIPYSRINLMAFLLIFHLKNGEMWKVAKLMWKKKSPHQPTYGNVYHRRISPFERTMDDFAFCVDVNVRRECKSR